MKGKGRWCLMVHRWRLGSALPSSCLPFSKVECVHNIKNFQGTFSAVLEPVLSLKYIYRIAGNIGGN